MDQGYKLCYIFSYSASSELSGITHNATAFVTESPGLARIQPLPAPALTIL